MIKIDIQNYQLNGEDMVVASYAPFQLSHSAPTHKKAVEGLILKLDAVRDEASKAMHRCERLLVEHLIDTYLKPYREKEKAGDGRSPDLG